MLITKEQQEALVEKTIDMISPYVYVGLVQNKFDNETELAKEIIGIVANHFGIDRKTILAKSRKKEILIPRQIATWLVRLKLNIELVKIGEIFGGQDHTTVINSIRAINNDIDTNNKKIINDIQQIKNKTNNLIFTPKELHSTNFSSTKGQRANFKRNQKKHS